MEGKKVYGPYEAVMLGIELEEAGYVFYSRVAEAAHDFRVKELFQFLADAEAEHKRIIREEIEPRFAPEWYRDEDQEMMAEYLRSVEKQPVFPDPDEAVSYAENTEDARKALEIGILAEKKAIDHFAFLRDATQDEDGKDAFHRLHLEEIKHLHLLERLIKDF